MNSSFKYESCGTLPSPMTTFRQNQNPTNGLNARARSRPIDQVQLKKNYRHFTRIWKSSVERW